MKLSLPKKLLELPELEGKNPEIIVENMRFYGYRDGIEINSQELPDDYIDLIFLLSKANEKEISGCSSLIQKLGMVISLRGDITKKKVKRLDLLEHALTEYISKNSIKYWLFRLTGDNLEPYLVTKIVYYPREKDSPACTTISMIYISMGEQRNTNLTWYTTDLSNAGMTVNELLENKGYYHESKESHRIYGENWIKYGKFINMFGEQFWGTGHGYQSGRTYEYSEKYSLSRDNKKSRLVNDTEQNKTPSVVYNGSFWSSESESALIIPIHPYLYMFDLEAHNHMWVHVNNLEIYIYDKTLKDKLILPTDIKDLIDILTTDIGNNMQDIIAGKTGGTFIICKGLPGVGKTLSAEVYSEVIERPLYVVQSSQLGIDIKDLETNLKKVLSNANKWSAVLLIDEADVYIHERGENIVQNAVVGIFLRVLEYYNGLLFMTTNRERIIDEAILSRATAIIEYKIPTHDEALNITKILAKQYNCEFEKGVETYIVDSKPKITGRSIKNIIRMAKKLSSGGKIDKKHLDIAFNYVYINGDNDTK